MLRAPAVLGARRVRRSEQRLLKVAEVGLLQVESEPKRSAGICRAELSPAPRKGADTHVVLRENPRLGLSTVGLRIVLVMILAMEKNGTTPTLESQT